MSGFDYSKEYQEYWSREDRWGSSSFADAEDLALRVLKVGGGGSVLDVGCGMGELVHALLRLGVDATGTDIAPRCIDEGNRRAPGRFKAGSLLELPFADASFETVVCTDMLEHLAEEDIPNALSELVRVARSTLFVCVSTREDRDKRWHLTIKPRQWWEQQFIERAVRKHPRSQSVLEYAAIDAEVDSGNATLMFEVIPALASKQFPLKSLKAERDLHTDMLREAGRRSDAHVARYQIAAQYVRPSDRVLDVSSGLGYGSAIMWANAEPEYVTGIDLSTFAVQYANANYALSSANNHAIAFRVGDAHDLSSIKDGSVDLVVSFETLEHLQDPGAFLTEAHRVLSPGGRFIASVPNDWTDENGTDPNPDHLHVYDWDKLAGQVAQNFMVEAAFSQIAGGGMKLTDAGRTLAHKDVQPDGEGPAGKAEWWLIVAMKDSVGATKTADANRHFPVLEDDDTFNVTNFARDYDNPWLVRSMVSIGLRAESDAVLQSIASRTLETARHGSPDEGAALCVIGYRHLLNTIDASDLDPFLKQIEKYQKCADKSPHAWRWHISNEYVAACLLLRAGRRDAALKAFQRCASMDPSAFSPLLATKTVSSCFEAGMMLIASGDENAARAMWHRGIEAARNALSGDWNNIVGDFDNPLSFGLAEACEVLDAATRCSWALIEHQQVTNRAGYAWEASVKRSPLGDLRWLRDLNQAKEWHESQHANWRRLAMDRERDIKHWSDAAESLRSGKEWLEAERGRLSEHGRVSEETIEDLRSWIDEQESGNQWLEEQRQKLFDEVGKRDQTIQELRAWIEQQDTTKVEQEKHAQQQNSTIKQMQLRIEELRAWISEQDRTKATQTEHAQQQAVTIQQMNAHIEELSALAVEQDQGRAWLDEQRTMLLEMNASGERQLRETRIRIAEFEEQCASLQEQCARLRQSNTQSHNQVAILRNAQAQLSLSHYDLLDRLGKTSQRRFGVRKSVIDLIESASRQQKESNGRLAASENEELNNMDDSGFDITRDDAGAKSK